MRIRKLLCIMALTLCTGALAACQSGGNEEEPTRKPKATEAPADPTQGAETPDEEKKDNENGDSSNAAPTDALEPTATPEPTPAHVHEWIEATCTQPMTCATCGETTGDLAAHEFMAATLNLPKHCVICGYTEGEALSISTYLVSIPYADWIYISPKYSFGVDYPMMSEDDLEGYKVYKYLYDGTEMPMIELPYEGEMYISWTVSSSGYMIVAREFEYDDRLQVLLYAPNSEMIYETGFSKSTFNWIYDATTGGLTDYGNLDVRDNYIQIVMYGSRQTVATLRVDGNNVTEVSEDEFESIYQTKKMPDTPEAASYTYCGYIASCDRYLVSDGDLWYHLDGEGNVLGCFVDASGFNSQGYALVTEDGTTFNLINSDMDLICEGIATGTGCFVSGDTLCVRQEQGNYLTIIVE